MRKCGIGVMDHRRNATDGRRNYLIRGGREGREPLQVIGRTLAPTTSRLLDRIGSIAGATVIDVAGGIGSLPMSMTFTECDDTAISFPGIFQAWAASRRAE